MIESIFTKLTFDLVNSFKFRNVIYAEVASAGAMGNTGGIIMYVIIEEQFLCLEVSVFEEKEIYKFVALELSKHKRDINCDYLNYQDIFDFINGGMGNNVFVNINCPLKVGNGFLIYQYNNHEYKIDCSCLGVFDNVLSALNILKSES